MQNAKWKRMRRDTGRKTPSISQVQRHGIDNFLTALRRNQPCWPFVDFQSRQLWDSTFHYLHISMSCCLDNQKTNTAGSYSNLHFGKLTCLQWEEIERQVWLQEAILEAGDDEGLHLSSAGRDQERWAGNIDRMWSSVGCGKWGKCSQEQCLGWVCKLR